ncbi:MAG: trp RNA-binding attenuation protein MtrB [Firmicutes bacterium]|nr:trp RNA-binding attenuation protein MtrB [Bacillota bacterium]
MRIDEGKVTPGLARYVVVLARQNGVQVIGMTRGEDTRFHHTERLDAGEAMIAQFTDVTAAIKVRGRATLYTDLGTIEVGETE